MLILGLYYVLALHGLALSDFLRADLDAFFGRHTH
jgi:hypothetical protein